MEKNYCKYCVWGRHIAEEKYWCMFPRCVRRKKDFKKAGDG